MAAQPLFSEAQRRLGQALAQALLKPPSAKRSRGNLPWLRARRWVGRHLGWSLVRLAAGSALAGFPAWLSLSQALSTPPAANHPWQALAATCGLLAVFCCLLLERKLSQTARDEWPEARPLADLLRGILPALLLPSLIALAALAGYGWTAAALPLAGAWIALLCAEQLLRSLLRAFQPHQRELPQRPVFGCLAAAVLRGGWRAAPSLPDVQLRQSWALRYMAGTAPQLLAALAGLAWLLSSLNVIAVDQRGIYERFGQAAAVWQPGLHLGLPWPLGAVRLIENGAVHQMGVGLSTPATADQDRLWDGSHGAETMQLIASGQGERQTTQLMALDVRLVYRLGLSDRAALDSYRQADAPGLLRDIAGQAILHAFASQQLDALLGAELAGVSRQLRLQIQSRLDAADSGLELLAVVIQSIHPPAAAANAYHNVQAAQIQAQANVARERGQAVRALSAARQQARLARDEASAAAAEKLAAGQAASIAFSADRQAAQAGGQAFLLERYLHRLRQGLAGASPIIIDHRIDPSGMPMLDLRSNANPAGPPLAAPDGRH
ncbi:SPFH domain-containing protein [Chromobacterium paludis]|uniref:Protease modulator HflK n=1 Tax=Chromobacterium paludis TaxID=2605945 RepID=A0A5C1DG16_9NEIS|nr:SPFH domain-containing protein [Chromobacterium paludis]QEL54528.1 protease modulator HflK [Chromobacterium paludis]